MTDDEMRAMPIPALQDEGLLFLWVTGRAMEVGRECMRVWGYTRVDEVVWLKTNQVRLPSIYSNETDLHLQASTRNPNRSNRSLVKPHERTHASWDQDAA